MSEPLWLAYARQQVGTREIKGAKHEPKILAWWKAIKRGGIKDDETPWCAAFVGACLEAVGIVSSRYESAKSYIAWGIGLKHPIVGAVAVLVREGGGHVGFVVGRDRFGNILLLGGNQSDAVNIRAFNPGRIVGYRWPAAVPLIEVSELPVISAGASTGEA